MTASIWPERRLGDLATMMSGGTPPSTVQSYYGGGVPWVSIADMTASGKYVQQTAKTLTHAGLVASGARMYESGVVLYAMYASLGECSLPVGRVSSSQAILGIKPGSELDRNYLYYFLDSIKPLVRSTGQQGTQANLNADMVRNFRLPLPPIAEQRRIAQAIGDVDRFVALLMKLIAKKKAVKQGVLHQLLTGEIRLPGFVEPWAKGTFGQLAAPSRERVMPQDASPTAALVELEHIEGDSGRLSGASQASKAVSPKAVFKPGDVLFGRLRAYLRKFWYADTAGLCTTEVWVLRARDGVHGRFVRYVVETDEFVDAASGAYGTHMPRSDWSTVRSLPVGIPTYDEQIAIASVLADTDAELDRLHQRLAKARCVKQGMMQELLSGRTRLPESGVAV